MELDYDYLCKTVIVGDSGVGKSSLILRFSDGVFTTSHIATVGVDFKIKTIEQEGKRVKTQLWDTAGQERFHSIVTSYYRGAHAIILVYDVMDPESFASLSKWLADVRSYASANAVVLIIGNKCDAKDRRMAVPEADARAFAEANNCAFVLTSAKNNTNVDEAFESIIRQFLDGPDHLRRKPKPINKDIHGHVTPVHTAPKPTSCACL
jgi:small GTP-binding protein